MDDQDDYESGIQCQWKMLVGGIPTPKNMSSSMGRIIPYIMKNKKCLKPLIRMLALSMYKNYTNIINHLSLYIIVDIINIIKIRGVCPK